MRVRGHQILLTSRAREEWGLDLTDTFEAVLPSVVAIAAGGVPKQFVSAPPIFPPIIGTGFFVRSDGIVATNRHVLDEVHRLTKEGWSFKAIVFIPGFESDRHTMRLTVVDILNSVVVSGFIPGDRYFGNPNPDIGFIRLKVTDVPALELAKEAFYIRPGSLIGTAGFPLGNVALTALGNRPNQMTPFLRRGIVSSVIPFAVESPQGFTIDILQQGGSSGSPIFREDEPVVVGMMSSSMLDGAANTNISLCVPSGQIHDALVGCEALQDVGDDSTPTLLEHVQDRQHVTMGFQWETN